jgi:hypothetical protein
MFPIHFDPMAFYFMGVFVGVLFLAHVTLFEWATVKHYISSLGAYLPASWGAAAPRIGGQAVRKGHPMTSSRSILPAVLFLGWALFLGALNGGVRYGYLPPFVSRIVAPLALLTVYAFLVPAIVGFRRRFENRGAGNVIFKAIDFLYDLTFGGRLAEMVLGLSPTTSRTKIEIATADVRKTHAALAAAAQKYQEAYLAHAHAELQLEALLPVKPAPIDETPTQVDSTLRDYYTKSSVGSAKTPSKGVSAGV